MRRIVQNDEQPDFGPLYAWKGEEPKPAARPSRRSPKPLHRQLRERAYDAEPKFAKQMRAVADVLEGVPHDDAAQRHGLKVDVVVAGLEAVRRLGARALG